MQQVIEYEFSNFLSDMARQETFCRYLDECEYEDEYSHNQIHECQSVFIDRVEEWLHTNKPSQYIITSGWCVFIMTVYEAKKRNIRHYEKLIVN